MLLLTVSVWATSGRSNVLAPEQSFFCSQFFITGSDICRVEMLGFRILLQMPREFVFLRIFRILVWHHFLSQQFEPQHIDIYQKEHRFPIWSIGGQNPFPLLQARRAKRWVAGFIQFLGRCPLDAAQKNSCGGTTFEFLIERMIESPTFLAKGWNQENPVTCPRGRELGADQALCLVKNFFAALAVKTPGCRSSLLVQNPKFSNFLHKTLVNLWVLLQSTNILFGKISWFRCPFSRFACISCIFRWVWVWVKVIVPLAPEAHARVLWRFSFMKDMPRALNQAMRKKTVFACASPLAIFCQWHTVHQ